MSVPELKSLYLSHLRPDDISSIADPSISALSVPEVLAISHAIDHQLHTMKRGILGADIEPFITHLLSSSGLSSRGGGGSSSSSVSGFTRMPSAKEIKLCRRLAQIEDDDIVTQMQILRMLDVFRKLTLIFSRVSVQMIEELAAGGTANPNRPAVIPGRTAALAAAPALSVALSELVELNADIAASTAALTAGSTFSAPSYDGVIPASVVYMLAEAYGLDARACFRKNASVSFLPTSDETVVALRNLIEEHHNAQQLHSSHKKSLLPSGGSGLKNASAAAAASEGGMPQLSPHSPAASPAKNSVVPIEFITTSSLTDAFLPLDDKMLSLFTKTFGAIDPNDLGLSDLVVDGHLMLILPIRHFASVLQLSVSRAMKVIKLALHGVSSQSASSSVVVSNSSFASPVRRRLSHKQGDSSGGITAAVGGVVYDEVEDIFGTGIGTERQPSATAAVGTGHSKSQRMSLITTGASGLPAAGHTSLVKDAGSDASAAVAGVRGDSNASAASISTSAANESQPADYKTVAQRGYLRYPEFELVIQFLNGQEVIPSDKRRDEQQKLVDALVFANSSTGGGGASADGEAAARQLRKRKLVPDGEEEKMLIDEQADFFASVIFQQQSANGASGGTAQTTGSKSSASRNGGTTSISVPPAASLKTNPLVSPRSQSPTRPAEQPAATNVQTLNSQTAAAEVPQHVLAAQLSPPTTANTLPHTDTSGRAGRISPKRKAVKKARAASPRQATGSADGPVNLHGWEIHPHHSPRLATNPFNGRDVQRLRRSVVASPNTAVQSFTAARQEDSVQQSKESTAAQSNTATFSMPLDSGAKLSGAVAAGSLTAGASGGASSTVAFSPRQRELMQVINWKQMQRVLADIPEDPMLLMDELRASGSRPGGNVFPVSTGSGNMMSTSSNAMMPGLLSLPSLSQQDPALVDVFASDGDVSTKKTPRSTSKTSRAHPARSVTTLGANSSSQAAAASTRSNHYHNSTNAGVDDPNEDAAAFATPRASVGVMDRSVSLVGPQVSPAASAVFVAGPLGPPATSEEAPGCNVDPADSLRPQPENETTDKQQSAGSANAASLSVAAKNGIHEKPWRAVHYIPKLRSEEIGAYCSTVKRSGGGFGHRGLTADDPTASGSPERSDHDSKPVGPETTLESKATSRKKVCGARTASPVAIRKSMSGDEEDAASQDAALSPRLKAAPRQPKAPDAERKAKVRPTRHQQKPQPDVPSLSVQGGCDPQNANLVHLPPIVSPSAQPTSDMSGDAVRKPRNKEPVVGGAASRTAHRHSRTEKSTQQQQRVPSATSARKPLADAHEMGLSAAATASHPDPSVEQRRHFAAAPAVSSNRGGAPTASPRRAMGVMAIMDPSRQHAGGSMLSFIPAALAAEVMSTLDLRYTYPHNSGGAAGGAAGWQRPQQLLMPPPPGAQLATSTSGHQAAPSATTADPFHRDVMQRNKDEVNALRYK